MIRFYVSAAAVGTLLFCLQQFASGPFMAFAKYLQFPAAILLLYPGAGDTGELLNLQPGQTIWAVKHTQDYFQDNDKDGYGNPDVSTSETTPPAGYVTNADDCDDTNADLNPYTKWYLDEDGDGYYVGEAVVQCASPGTGYRYNGLQGPGDCNDSNEFTNPGAEEIPCNYEDDNCNGFYDEPAPGAQPFVQYYDQDEDGFGSGPGFLTYCLSRGLTWKAGDCNDDDPEIYPGAMEWCNGKDDDCDGAVDEGFDVPDGINWYLDADSDGYGDPNTSSQACLQPAGYVLDNTDVDDTDGTVWQIGTFYADQDGDGYTVANASEVAFGNSIPQGFASEASAGSDCDDSSVDIHPNALEQCNGIDDNCNGQIDEGCWPRNSVTSFSLINALTDMDLGTLADGSIIDLSQIKGGSINIKANTNPGVVGSVVLQLSGPRNRIRIENNAPYCVAPNNATMYFGWIPAPGTYTLTATPFTESKGRGLAGTPLTIHFTVVAPDKKQTTIAAPNRSSNQLLSMAYEGTANSLQPAARHVQLRTFPNPTTGDINLQFTLTHTSQVSIQLVDAAGKTMYEMFCGTVNGGITQQKRISTRELVKGFYWCRLVLDNGQVISRSFIKQ